MKSDAAMSGSRHQESSATDSCIGFCCTDPGAEFSDGGAAQRLAGRYGECNPQGEAMYPVLTTGFPEAFHGASRAEQTQR